MQKKTVGGYLGHLKAFFDATKSIEGCPLCPYGYYLFLKSQPKSENLILHKENSNDTNCPNEQVLAKF